jgi:hypothetical protein
VQRSKFMTRLQLREATVKLARRVGLCESASNIDPTLIRVQAIEVSAKFVNFFGSHRRPIVTPRIASPANVTQVATSVLTPRERLFD